MNRVDQQLALITCPLCGSENAKLNRARTIFCLECNYCFSRRPLLWAQRMITHPLYAELGYRIRFMDPDATQFDFDTRRNHLAPRPKNWSAA